MQEAKSAMQVFLESEQSTIDKKLKDILFALNQSAIIAITDRTGKITFANEQFVETSQYTLEELIGETHRIINSNYHSKAFFKDLWRTIGRGNVWRGEIRNRKKDGSIYWVDTTIVPFLNEKGVPYQYVSFRYDVTNRKKAEEKIHHLAYNDQLTELPNRLHFRRVLAEKVSIGNEENIKFCLAKLNIDRFRYINDALGYEMGDYALSVVAGRLKDALPEDSVVARLSGDEFAFIFEDTGNAEKLTRKVQKTIQQPIEIAGQPYTLSVSIGVAYYPEHAEEATELSMKAEKALLEMRERGGSGCHVYEPGTIKKSIERMLLENELRKSIDLGYFHLDYQPKFDLLTQKITGVEALVRWDHPDLGRIPPNQFIDIAEETRMIVVLGEWILRKACHQARSWEKKGFYYSMAVNVSVVQLEDDTFLGKLKQILAEEGNRPDLLELELTESLFADQGEAQEVIAAIRELGVKVAIDDFGTGYSSFSYIRKLPADTLKIDRAFIKDLDDRAESRAIVEAILSVGKTVGLDVVAEGIEEGEQLKILSDLGCQQGQGYYFSRPTSPSECEKFMVVNRPG